jgi:hypothetical protein
MLMGPTLSAPKCWPRLRKQRRVSTSKTSGWRATSLSLAQEFPNTTSSRCADYPVLRAKPQFDTVRDVPICVVDM